MVGAVNLCLFLKPPASRSAKCVIRRLCLTLQLSATRLTLLIRLPVCPAFDVQASQPAAGVRCGVDADGVADVSRQPVALRRVAADHDFAGFMRRRIVERLPIQHVIRLFAKRDIRVRVGVNKEMPIRFVVWPAASLKEFPVCGRDTFKAAAVSANGVRTAAPRNRRMRSNRRSVAPISARRTS